jgi:hypothetical protein
VNWSDVRHKDFFCEQAIFCRECRFALDDSDTIADRHLPDAMTLQALSR